MRSKFFKVFLAEDDAMTREMVEDYIVNYPQLKLIKSASNAASVEKEIQSDTFDLLILDVQIQEINIFDILYKLKSIPYIIFISSYDKFAINAFDLGAVDYILKPFSRERFTQAIQRFFLKNDSFIKNTNQINSLFYQYKKKISAIPHSKILYIIAKGRNTLIETEEEPFICPIGISTLADRLIDSSFIRIHKSYIVNVQLIKQIIHRRSGLQELVLNDNDDTILPIGRKYSDSLKKYLSKNEEDLQ